MKRLSSRSCGTALLILILTGCLLGQAASNSPGQPSVTNGRSGVRVWEEQVVIPTYLIGPPDPNPQFYFGGASQGAQHRIYPYPAYDNLTTRKVDKSYKMVYLENEYLKVGLLPESGGKIFEAIDKTNGYNFFYRQHVIKPALISLLGAWISGGVEWDVPHHHRATSFLPVQYTIEESADGSQTVWVGELELRDRMRWAVGITLHPGQSCLEASFRVVNRTPLPTSMLCFSNVAVHVNEDYQAIFPPSTQWGTGHGKRDFTTWPLSNSVDLSWYKNIPNSRSVFAWNYRDDFSGGYDHGKNAGTMSIADHRIVPGKKFFTWGDGPAGHAEDTLLTDADGPYIELMVGAYSDNQPDYSWMTPHETRSWTQFWYPFRDIGGAKNANIDAAVNLEVRDGQVLVGFYTTSAHPAADVSLRLHDQVLLRQTTAISPGRPYVKEVAFPADANEHDLRVSLSAEGRELIAYSPIRLQPEARPEPVTRFSPAAQIKTNEELYLAGLRLEQFHAPDAQPDPYWQEALQRDPGDVRVHTALGIDALRAGRCAEAEQHFRQALQRATDRHTAPKDGEPFYYLGLALKAQGKTDEALDQFAKSTWSGAWRNAGYFEMAQIASLHGDFPAALTYVVNSLNANSEDTRALALKSAILRHRGQTDAALATAEAIRRIDPLDVHALAECWMARPTADSARQLQTSCHAHPATALEAAADYLNAGLWQDGTTLLTQVVDGAADKSEVSPLVFYYLGYFARQLDRPRQAAEYFRQAAQAPTDYVFPFQMEMTAVLEAAMTANPSDSRAPYYLGNLLYDGQPDRAVALWEKSASLGADFPVVYRNLALIYTRRGGQRDKALAALEKAASCGGNAMVFDELDKLYEENGVEPEKRLALLETHQQVINRDDVISREVNLAIFAGKADLAIQLLQSRFFRAWEGGGRFSLGDSWVNAHLTRGHQHFAARRYHDALADYRAALEMPSNLQEARGNIAGRKGEISYWIGTAYEALGDLDRARPSWRDAAEASTTQRAGGRGRRGGGGSVPPGQFSGRSAMGGMAAGVRVAQAALYYQALALRKLGEADRAQTLFQQLVDTGTQSLADASEAIPTNGSISPGQRARRADAHYLVGLGRLGLNQTDAAKQEFSLALQASPDHWAAKTALVGVDSESPTRPSAPGGIWTGCGRTVLFTPKSTVNQMLIFGERHLEYVIKGYMKHYHTERAR
jgi:tetratricopeptide (TPR) repeat protein